jgi:hypothetical protein
MKSEKLFEHTEHKIKEAAENNQIVFEEDSWVKMEALLDKDDKKKPLAWLWFLLPLTIITIIAVYTASQNKKNENSTTKNLSTTNKKEPIVSSQISGSKKATLSIVDNSVVKNKLEPIATSINADDKKSNITKAIIQRKDRNHNAVKRFTKATKVNEEGVVNSYSKTDKKIIENSKKKITIKNAEVSEDEPVGVNATGVEKSNELLAKKINTAIDTIAKKDSNIIVKKTAEVKKKYKKLARFYILASAGVDAGSVKLLSFDNSRFVPKYGIGIGYNITQRLSAQIGFYSAKKKYLAGPTDYKAKAGTYISNRTLTKVDAACLVYELPISFRYNFLQKKSLSAFASIGLVSYIMKNEDYNYFYKYYGTEVSRAYSYSGNKHLFSNLQISTGVEKSISKHIALQLEPAVSIPLKGVGEGSVKLFSTSLLLGIKYRPFNK